ncbi:pentapeptide repeat-containing protein [Nocardioides sp. zg-1308]|uniref:pentapeptide repeat-containing protein n=1 Tax=Nocardioides sp. zg-1308 TaxID=2736253 RepID=UPI001553D2E7|nr:pentapeptide repeat-containing protein [Nocardioides sp. zg-1308]
MATPGLVSDCAQCFGLCCVLLPFSAAAGFGVDKPGGRPCLNLLDEDRCGIHATLREDGWPGCTVFECFGAGQQVSQVTYAGVSWREPGPPHRRAEMGAVLSVMRQLHEMLVHLTEVDRRSPDPATAAVRAEIEALTGADPETLLTSDVDGLQGRVGRLLADASTRVRQSWPAAGDRSHRDLAGRRLGGDHRGWTFRGALMIRADLRGARLADADLLGADLRDADVRGCDLSTTLFLTQPQVNGAIGDAATALPPGLSRPGHWGGAPSVVE